MAEGNAGTTTMNFTVTLSAVPTAPVSVTVSHTPITATAGADYVLALTSLTWAAGDAVTKTVPVTIVGDTAVEPDETFEITLSAPVGATLDVGAAVGTGTILNDDAVAPAAASATAIPTLSEWALALLALACAVLGMQRLRRS